MARRSTQWFLTLQVTLCLFLMFVVGSEDAEDGYKNGRNLVLEYFLPINLPSAVDVPLRREKRDVEGSGEEESVFSEIEEKTVEDVDNSTQNAFAKLTQDEGSGEVDVSESSETSSEEKSEVTVVPIAETTTQTENRSDEITEPNLTSTEMIFDKSEDFDQVSTMRTEETTTVGKEVTPPVIITTSESETTTLAEEMTTVESGQNEFTTPTIEETTTVKKPETTTVAEETTTVKLETTTVIEETTTEPTTLVPLVEDIQTTKATETTTVPPIAEETTTAPPAPQTLIPILVPHIIEETTKHEDTSPRHFDTTKPEFPTTPKPMPTIVIPNATEGIPVSAKPPTTPEPIVEEVFKETKMDKKLEALPGNILQKENLSLAADPLLIANTRLMDSEENVHLSSSEPKRLGAYIVIGLILLSFSSLVGYITFKKRMNRKRLEFESHQESHDTEKALLSLSDYKDNSELEENHLKNNEITPIVVKSNSQINKFEKNTNFSSPKNLNTIANEKNIEKDNVLKSTAENLTQVIIEDSPKDVEEDKNAPSMEKLIVKTRIDQDSIPKKPIIINRTSAGYLPIPQDSS